jgi:hypothetical protein
MGKLKNKRKLWQSMINTNLTPDEFVQLIALGKIRSQSLRELVSYILRQEIKAFHDVIMETVDASMLLPSLEANASKKRLRGRPRNNDARIYLQTHKEKLLPVSMEQIITEKLKE